MFADRPEELWDAWAFAAMARLVPQVGDRLRRRWATAAGAAA